MIPLRILATSVCAGWVLLAQTPAEIDAIRQSLDTIQQKSSVLKTMIESAVKPANWRDQVIADSNAILAAATVAKTTAQTAQTVTLTSGQSITVPPGGSIQNALNGANAGDTIILQAGATYPGGFTLPAKAGTAYITITTSAAASLPEGKRVRSNQAALLARIVGVTGSAVIATAPGAHHYRLIGLDILTLPGVYAGTAVQLGSGLERSVSELPSDIELDRMWIHGEAPGWAKRGVALNGVRLKLKNSTVSGFRSTWQDTQAVCIWNTPGQLEVSNNYLEAAGMALLVGGAEPALTGVTPSDIQITGNLMSRPVAWRSQPIVVKNVLELKTGRRVTITGNILENSWTAAQAGYAVNIKPGTENIRTPAITSDVLFSNNIVRHTAGGVVLSGTNTSGGKVSNITIRGNLYEDIGAVWGANLSLFVVLSSLPGLIVENNTAAPNVAMNTLVLPDGGVSTGFVFRANIAPRGAYGVKGTGRTEGTSTITAYMPGALFTNNVIYATGVNLASNYPAGNYFPITAAEVGWADAAGGNYRLSTTSTYKGTGLGGQNPGANLDTLLAATAKSLTGQ